VVFRVSFPFAVIPVLVFALKMDVVRVVAPVTPNVEDAVTAPVKVLAPANDCVVVSTIPFAVVLAEVNRARGTVPVESAEALIPVVDRVSINVP
jgi:hypothetical protein